VAALSLGLSLGAQARSAADSATADIRRTTFGVPHILARDERGLGFGIGYAYAQDNLCLLANEVVTVNAERSKYFGPQQLTLEERDNLTSDLFFQWLDAPGAAQAFWAAQPVAVRERMEGYVAGYNQWLHERQAQGLPAGCAAAWVRPITTQDLVKLTRRLLVEGGAGQFAEALAGAAPPQRLSRLDDPQRFQVAAERLQRFALDRGSNGVAIGGERSFNGRGLLLANPHFPWGGGMRFYQMHLTIPGQLDVMGAALPGLPLINIGFNQHLAWTHTVDTSRHFTLFRLQLDPQDSTRYLLDGQSLPMTRRTLSVEVREPDGSVRQHTRVVYSSVFGPVVQWPGKLDWNDQTAFSLKDANLDNDRVLRQWDAMNRAPDLAAFQAAVNRIHGIPWVNTLAADDRGQALYMNLSMVPHVDERQLERCSDPRMGLETIVLDGSRRACNWQQVSGSEQQGTWPASQQPQLLRRDFVQNSNDSAWMVNPAAPLTGYSPLISRQDIPVGARSRFALQRLKDLQQAGPVSVQDLQRMVMDNRVYLADLVMPDLLHTCTAAPAADKARLASVCASLQAWDRTANLDAGLGMVHFDSIMTGLMQREDLWRVPFDPADPQHTPRGLNLDRVEVAQAVREAMLAAATESAAMALPADSRWGDIQGVRQGATRTPIHGGPSALGVYNAMQSVPTTAGQREVVSGTSYLQVVSFDGKGPQALGLLAFSQSSDPASAHASDQTAAFSRKQWAVLPFSEAQIKADAHYRRQVVKEQPGVGPSGAVRAP